VESVQAGQAVEVVREDADTPAAPLVYQGGRWSPTGWCRPRATWPCGANNSGSDPPRGRAGVTVTFWADHDTIHLSIAGARIKTLRSHLSTTDLAALATTGERPAGPPPLSPAQPSAALELDRTVSPGGLVSLGAYRLLAAEILAGRRISIRIEALMFFDPDTRELLRTRPNPLTYDQARTLRGARPAGPPPRPSVEPVTIQRRVWDTGVIMVAGHKLALGRSNAHTVVTVHVAEYTITVEFPDGAQRTFTRTSTKPVRSYKAQHPRTPHTDDQPAAGT
jgi:hypothetical protein